MQDQYYFIVWQLKVHKLTHFSGGDKNVLKIF